MSNSFSRSYAIVFTKPRQAEFKSIPLTSIDDDTTVVQTTMSAISSGTDMKTWLGLQSGEKDVWFPLIPGYEAVGKVVHVGKNVKDVQVGQRVMSNEVRVYPEHCAAWGGNAQYAIKNKLTGCDGMNAVALIPENVSDEEAVVAYLVSVAKRGVDKVGVKPDETVVVIGAGNVGLSACQLFRIYGAKQVICVDIHDTRLSLAKKFADHVVDARCGDGPLQVKAITGGRGADVVFETSGNPAVVASLAGYLRDGGWGAGEEGGRIHLQGDYPDPLVIDHYHRWFVKNLTLSMSCAFRPGDKQAILQLISQGQFDAKSLYSEVMPVEQCGQAYEKLHANRYDLLKILFRWPS
jgi:2-desacetyl-2-hydroxyethyl bacteriochlorophyllide A dehydrogenase